MNDISANQKSRFHYYELKYYLIFLQSVLEDFNQPDRLIIKNKITNLLSAIDSNDTNHSKEKITKELNHLMLLLSPYQSNFFVSMILQILGLVCAAVCVIVMVLLSLPILIFSMFFNKFFDRSICFYSHLVLAIFGAVGYIGGYHLPLRLMRSPLTCNIDFLMYNFRRLVAQNEFSLNKIIRQVEDDIKLMIGDKTFAQFLIDEHQFQVCTYQIGYVSKKFRGYLGHHALIRYTIYDHKSKVPIEFGLRQKVPNFVNQYEMARKVTGAKLFEMLVFDQLLQQTHAWSKRHPIYWRGYDDCFTYVNKILLGTNQVPARITRFHSAVDQKLCTYFIKPILALSLSSKNKSPLLPSTHGHSCRVKTQKFSNYIGQCRSNPWLGFDR